MFRLELDYDAAYDLTKAVLLETFVINREDTSSEDSSPEDIEDAKKYAEAADCLLRYFTTEEEYKEIMNGC